MSEPYLSQIEAFPFGFAPKGWALCAGQLLPIQQNQALFALIGTYYGGNGVNNFALPDLRGRVAVRTRSGRRSLALRHWPVGRPGDARLDHGGNAGAYAHDQRRQQRNGGRLECAQRLR